jgi:hypothetical protein
MKKTLLLFVLLVISTTSYAGTGGKEYSHWGNLNDGGMKSKVPYPKDYGYHARTHKVNPSSYGKYLGFSIFLKTTNVNEYAIPYIFLSTKEDKNITKTIWGKSIKGTKSWKRYYTPHIYVPLHAAWVVVGVKLKGAGKVEYYDDQLKEYSYK